MLACRVHSLATQTAAVVRNSSITTCLSRVAFMQVEGQRNDGISRYISHAIIGASGRSNQLFQLPFPGSPSALKRCHAHGSSVC